MISVYFDSKCLIITDKNNKFSQIKEFSEIKDRFNEFLQSFLRDGKREIEVLFHANIHEVLDELKKEYIYIEAAGGIVKNTGNEILCIYRLGKWDLPKGKCEQGETVQETAIREVSEECGLNEAMLKIICELPSSFHTYSQKGKQYLKRTYWFCMNYSGVEIPRPQKEENITDIQWINIKNIDKIENNTYNSIKKVLLDFKLSISNC
ncbi:MAG: NUDIX domain-containing protein [Bacteroidales bacterium]